jgi:hypothetical protein
MIEEVVLGSDIHKCQRLSPEMYGLIARLVMKKYNINHQISIKTAFINSLEKPLPEYI